MFKNLDPARALTHNGKVDRRTALAGFGALAGAPLVAGLAGCAPSSPPSTPAANSLKLDFSKPEDNLTAWVKLVSSLEDGVETCGYFTGTQYAVIGSQEVIKPLFRIAGFGMSRVSLLPDGRYENLHREVVFYMDLKEDRILETWDNPYTGETVDIFDGD